MMYAVVVSPDAKVSIRLKAPWCVVRCVFLVDKDELSLLCKKRKMPAFLYVGVCSCPAGVHWLNVGLRRLPFPYVTLV